MPETKWRLTSSFPKSLDTIYGAAEVFAKAVAEATDNKFQIQVFAAGEIVPGLQAARRGDQRHGRDVPHRVLLLRRQGPDLRVRHRACRSGSTAACRPPGSISAAACDLMNEFYKKANIYRAFRAAIPAARWAAGSARRSRRSADLNGLKMRIGGFAGRVLTKLGVVPQQLAGGDIYPALEKGTLDACEWVGPYDDEKLGFQKVAQYYYYPGWWEGGAMLHNFINIEKWNALPPTYKSIVQHRLDGGARVDAGEVRCRESGRAQAAGRGRRAASPVPASRDGRVLQGVARALQRGLGRQCRLQEGLGSRRSRSAATSICGGRWPNTPTTPS